jgi:membrane peptidoglycan carboxypeptidase
MMTRRTTRRGSRRRGFATFLLVTLGVFGLTFVGSVMGTAGGMFAAYNYFASDLPDPKILDGIEPPQSTYVYDRSGQRLLARFECQNRESVEFSDLPDVIWQATISAEDRTFWENTGVDFQGIVRAAVANLEAGQIVQGASTITQQVIDYARVLQEEGESTQVDPDATPAPDVVEVDPDELGTDAGAEEAPSDVCEPPAPHQSPGIEDKIRENILAMQVTEAYPGRAGKERILETYFNLIYYGNGSYGIKAAAANYFGLTNLDDMTIAQAAFLAGLPQRPSFYDPFQNPAGDPGSEEAAAPAIARRNLILDAMLQEGYITAAQARQARNTSWLEMNPSRLTSILLEPHFSFRVRNEAERILAALGVEDPQAAVRIGGYRIRTTLDYELQQVAHELVGDHVKRLNTDPGEDPEFCNGTDWAGEQRRCANFNVNNGAMVAIDSATGEIIIYVGSVDYYNREDPRVQGQFDIAGLARRQPGSAYKPITYASAFKSRDATVATMFVDAMTEFGLTEETSYRPTNAGIREHGPVLAVDALRYSYNIPSVMMQYLVGSQTTAEFSEALGIASTEYIMSLDPGLSLALGSIPFNLTNMTQAYGSFAQEGTVHPATTIIEIRDRNNRVVYTREASGPEELTPMTPAEAYLTHWILEGNTNPETNVLWGGRANLFTPDGDRRPAGFKTGTTNDFRDVSGFGYVPESLVTGVWMGNNNQESMSNEITRQGLFSADGPLYLWEDFMSRALNEPWEWNDQAPVGQTAFDQPDGIVTAEVCRWTGLAATNRCGPTITVPFLEGTVPPADNVHPRGCLDLEIYLEQAEPDRPSNWVEAAKTWADRVVNGQTAAVGDPNDYQEDEDVLFEIAPINGESGFPSVCGDRIAPTPAPRERGGGGGGRPTPAPTPEPDDDDDDGGGGPGGGGGGPPTPPPDDDE